MVMLLRKHLSEGGRCRHVHTAVCVVKGERGRSCRIGDVLL